MDETKNKSKGISIAIILLVIVIGFGFVIGLTQVTDNLNSKEKSEISYFTFDEQGNVLGYSGTKTDIVIPETYSFAKTSEKVEMASSSIYGLIERAKTLNIKNYTIKDETGNYTDDFGNTYYQEKYVLTYEKREVIEGDDYIVSGISNHIFQNNNNIKSITMPDTITHIDSCAFMGCSNLKTVKLSSNLERLENSVFFNCINLKEITLPETLTYIGPQCFQYCNTLTEITIPSGVNYISDMSFSNCNNLIKVTFNGPITQIASEGFANCRSLTEINIPSSLERIENRAFYNCRSLNNVILPSSIIYIGNQVFYNCTGMTDITINAINIPEIEYNCFSNAYIQNIYVLDELYDTYLGYGNWSNYAGKIRRISEKI